MVDHGHLHARHGFTLIELVTVIIILGIIAATALPRFVQNDPFELRTAQDRIISASRQARQLAMTKGATANVRLQLDNGNKRIRITYNEAGLQTIDLSLPTGLTYNNATINYNAIGDASPATTFSISGQSTRTVCIEATGYAYAC
jgi:MSHA pilin protein MshC